MHATPPTHNRCSSMIINSQSLHSRHVIFWGPSPSLSPLYLSPLSLGLTLFLLVGFRGSLTTFCIYCIFLTIRCSPPQIWEENGGVSYSLKVAYLARWGRVVGGRWSGVTGDRSRATAGRRRLQEWSDATGPGLGGGGVPAV